MSDHGPKAFIVDEPNSISVEFGGKHINITDLSRNQGLSISHVSRVLRGARGASVPVMMSLSSALGMTLDDFIAAVDDRRDMDSIRDADALKRYQHKLMNERKRKKRAATDGRPFVPNPALGRVS